MSLKDYQALAERFRTPDIWAMALMGSHARGEAGHFSDVDLVRFRDGEVPPGQPGTYLIDGRFVVVSDVDLAQIEKMFTEPEPASTYMAGMRSARILWDPDGRLQAIQERARSFAWDEKMQVKANAWASEQMVGWIEEVQKGLEGLRRYDEGRLLHARFGLSWGLTGILRVQRGVLISSDNGTYSETVNAVGRESAWAKTSRRAYGIDGGLTLAEQVQAGLELYVQTAALLKGALRPEDGPLVDEAVRRIRAEKER